MTDGPDITPVPGDPAAPAPGLSGLDSPGAEATAEQEAFVRGLLGSLRSDDPPIPDDVVRRIQAVLAEEQRTGAVGPATATALGDSGSDAEPGAGASVTVLPARSERGRGPSSTAFRWLAGAAAAVVVLGGAAVWVGQQGSGSSASTAAAGAADSEAGTAIRTTGTDYTKAALTTQATTLVRAARSDPAAFGSTGALAPAVTAPASSPAPSTRAADAPGRQGLVTAATLVRCVAELAQKPGVVPLAVDQASYEGKPADVIVIPAQDDATTLEVWVVGPGCGVGQVSFYEWRRIPIP